MYLRDDSLGQPNVPGTQVPMPNAANPPQPITQGLTFLMVRSKVQCTLAQRTQIQNILGGQVSEDDVLNAIQSAHDGVFADMTVKAMPPRRLLVAPRDIVTTERFKRAFGASPDALPWRGARWDLGRIVAQRLKGALATMFSSSVRISCFGYPFPGGGADRPLDYMVKALPKRERVGLGTLFWRAVRDNDAESQGAAILIAGLVIRYGISYRMLAPPLRNIHCYVKYCLLMLQRPLPPWVEEKCGDIV